MKKWLRIISVVFTAIYAVLYIVTTINKINTGRFDTLDYAYMASFLIFLGAFIICFDYPVIAGILFIMWSATHWIIYTFEDDYNAFYLLVIMLVIAIIISVLGILFIVSWWQSKSKW